MIECKRCGKSNFTKNGFVRGVQRYHCKSCGCNFTPFFTVAAEKTARMAREASNIKGVVIFSGKSVVQYVAFNSCC